MLQGGGRHWEPWRSSQIHINCVTHTSTAVASTGSHPTQQLPLKTQHWLLQKVAPSL